MNPEKNCEGAFKFPKSPRYQLLDAWRGLACLMVVISHSTNYVADGGEGGWLPWLVTLSRQLWIGVPIFFVISGYCISATADGSRLQEKPVIDYFIRRLKRIFPPYWAWLTITALFVWIVDSRLAHGFFQDGHSSIPSPSSLGFSQWLGNITLTEVWRAGYVGGPKSEILGHCWSLSYEEQFYAVTGLVLLFARKRFFLSFGVISMAVIVTSLILPRFHIHVPGVFLNAKWLMFAAGILVYYVVNYAPLEHRKWAFVVLSAAGLYALREPQRMFLTLINDVDQSLLVTAIFAAVAIALHPMDERLQDAFLLRPLRFCGHICYSLYLVHWPLVKCISKMLAQGGLSSSAATLLLVIPACIGASVCMAWAFHMLVERRFLKPSIWKQMKRSDPHYPDKTLALTVVERTA